MRQRREFNERRTPLTEHYYRSQFRFNEATVDYLVDTFLGPGSGETRGGALSNKKKMEITLRYMADPGFMNSVAEVVGVSQPTVSITVSAVVNAICAKAHEWIIFPQNTQEVDVAAQNWSTRRGFPLCFGVVDGCLIKIQVPPYYSHPAEYFSVRKKFHCMNVQIVCDAEYRILNVNASWPGSVHDARVWRNSAVFRLLSSGMAGDKLLIADSAYPISPFLMKPFSQAEATIDPVKRRFNTKICKDRVLVENTLGQLKSRFPMLRTPIRLSLEKVPSFIVACCVLHNVGKHLGDTFEDDKMDEPDGDAVDGDDGQPPSQGQVTSNAAAVRQAGQQRRNQIATII